MSANRLSWIGVGVVVLVVGILVARTMRQDAPAEAPRMTAAQPAGQASAPGERPRVAEQGARVPGTVHRAKQALKDKGYYQGPIDGNFDPPVIEALKKFQKDSGMVPTGHLDTKTHEALGIVVKSDRR